MTALAQNWRDDDRNLFEETVLAAAERIGAQPLAVEKDYWVCEALRAITTAYPDHIIFKGGTSLEKMRIIQRFSEDLDLLVIGELGAKNQQKAALKQMVAAAALAVHPEGTTTDERSGGNPGTFHRRAYLEPTLKNDATQGIADAKAIMVELGQSGGPHPSAVHQVESLLVRELKESELDTSQWADLAAIDVTILHPGRTLIEKLLRVNNFAVRDDARDDIHGWPRIGRQFYDIWALLGHQSVIDLLNDRDTVTAILDSVAQVSAQFTPDEPVPADGFAASSAFDPDGPLAARLEEQHDIAINDLYYGDLSSAPSFTEVTARIHEHAALLDMSPTQPAA